MKIKVDVNTTKKDYLAFQLHHTYRYIWVYLILFAFVVLLAALLIKNTLETGKINDSLVVLLCIATAIFLYVAINNVLKILKNAKNEDKKPVFEYTFTKGGIHCDSNGKSFDLPWTKVYKVTEIKKMFLVYINKESALIVPKQYFKSEDDINEFRQTLLFAPRKKEKKPVKKGIL